MDIVTFQQQIWDFYTRHGRTFAWRLNHDPYAIVVSEIMLQQTQTFRVEPKFEQFLIVFPDFATLAQSSLKDVLRVWQGLGYNRRGKALHDIAQLVVQKHNGCLPDDPAVLETFPGIGKATAASVCAFAFNKPTVFIETNIRAVFIHAFFYERVYGLVGLDKDNRAAVHDKELLPFVAATVDTVRAREWYYALMDYGVYLKKVANNPSKKSVHHIKQSKFVGSDRQIRGAIIRLLVQTHSMRFDDIVAAVGGERARVEKILNQLCVDQLIVCTQNCYSIG